MPLQKLQFRPGINREVTSYTNEGGWYDCDKVRFTKGYPAQYEAILENAKTQAEPLAQAYGLSV